MNTHKTIKQINIRRNFTQLFISPFHLSRAFSSCSFRVPPWDCKVAMKPVLPYPCSDMAIYSHMTLFKVIRLVTSAHIFTPLSDGPKLHSRIIKNNNNINNSQKMKRGKMWMRRKIKSSKGYFMNSGGKKATVISWDWNTECYRRLCGKCTNKWMTNKKAQKVLKKTHICEIKYKNKSHYKKIKHKSWVNIITLLK